MSRKTLGTRLLSSTILVFLALFAMVGCEEVPTPSPTAAPATATITLTPTAIDTLPTKAADILPTASPLAIPLHNPRVTYRRPAPGEEQPLDGAIAVSFDQPMDRASVEAAFQIEPAVQGELTWRDNTLLFQPQGAAYQRDAVYIVSIDGQAASAKGLSLAAPTTFAFKTVGYLRASHVQPADGAMDVDTDSDIIVTFNRPVVPLTSIQDQANLPQPLQFTPAIPGSGEWLNTAIYVYHPETKLRPATTYKVRLPAGLTDLTGGELEGDVTWSFTTELPMVVEALPFDGAQYVAPTSTITITFNHAIDRDSAQVSFSLRSEAGQPIAGQFGWYDDRTMVFRPMDALALNTIYRGTIDAGVRAENSPIGMLDPYTWRFTTIAAPQVVSTDPRNGDNAASPHTGIEITFNSPMDRASLLDNLTIIPEPTEVYSSWARSNTRLWLSFGTQPSSSYQVILGADLRGRYGHRLGAPHRTSFSTRALSPRVGLSTPSRIGTYNVYTDTVVYVNHLNVSSLSIGLYRVDNDAFMRVNSGSWWRAWDEYQPRPENLVSVAQRVVNAPLNQEGSLRLVLVDRLGQTLTPGIYYLEINAPGVQSPARHLLIVTPINLLVKHGDRELLLWATDLKSGQPLANVPISIEDTEAILAQGVTDESGLLSSKLPSHDGWEPLFAFARVDGGTVVAMTNWSNGIERWEFGLGGGWGEEPYRGALYTDRPIYRPGQDIYFKGILRRDNDGDYDLPPFGAITVAVHDSQGKQLYRQKLTLSDYGTFYDQFALDESAALGYYYIEAYLEDEDVPFYLGESFQVAEYRKPEFQVEVTADRDDYIQGDEIAVNVQASYFFGGAVREAQVNWSVMSQDYRFQWDGDGWWDFDDLSLQKWQEGWSAHDRFLSEGQGITDSEGRFTFGLPADLGDKTTSQVFTIEATIRDVNDQSVSARTSVIVHKGTFYIGLKPQEYVGQAAKPSYIDIITVDTQGITVPNQALKAVFYQQEWYSVQERDPDGRVRWTSQVEETEVLRFNYRTDEMGMVTATFIPPSGGTFRVRVTGQDERGNEISASTYLWVSSRKFTSWQRDNDYRIDLIADRKQYAPGDTARILVTSPFQGEVKALLTLERGHILERQVITLRSNSETIEVPITSAHIPNVYVSIFIVKGQDETNPSPSFRLGYVNLPVSPAEKKLTITLTPDQAVYRPGDIATYGVQATNQAGDTVPAELSLALIDLSVLTLSGDQGPDLMQRFYRERGLGIQTAASLALAVDEYVQEMADEAKAKGGDGGNGGGLDVRTDFPDTVYWNPAFRTTGGDQDMVQVELADNLTTWRMRAQAITLGTEVGQGQVDIIATKELLIRPVTPRFFVAGDQAQLAAVVHNNTDREIRAAVTLQAAALQVDQPEQEAVIPAQGLVKVTWQVTVPADAQALDLVFSAVGGGLSDAAAPTLGTIPVYRYSTPEIVGTAGQVSQEEPRVEVVQLPTALDPTQGELALKLEPSLAAGMRDGLAYLKTYPYDCVEQTVSRFLPNVITYRALWELDSANAELEAELAIQVNRSAQRLYALQNADGGWGWWASDSSQPYITAYALHGLHVARQADFAIDGEALKRAVHYLGDWLNQDQPMDRGYRANTRAYILHVLAQYDSAQGIKPDLGRAVSLYERRHLLDNYGLAYLAMALQTMAPEEVSRPRTLVNDLNQAAIRSATGAHWEEETRDYRAMGSDTRSTAIVLQALVRLDPENEIIPHAARWLMAARRNGRWGTTQENAWAILALTDYMVASGELEAGYGYRVALNDQLWAEGSVDVENLDQTRELVAPIDALRQDTGNRIWLERTAEGGQSGVGRLYYTLHLRYYVPFERIDPLNRGIILTRQYTLLDEPEQMIDTAQVGDVIRVKLTLIAPHDLHYLVVEDPLPAGCEAVDTSLETTSAAYAPASLQRADTDWPWWGIFAHTELRDEKVALFAAELAQGAYEYTYLMRASLPGVFHTLPTTGYEMYFPEVFGRSDSAIFTITPE